MKKLTLLFAFAAMLGCSNLFSQVDWCGNGKMLQNKLARNPELAAQYQDYLQRMQQMENAGTQRTTYNTVYIPVVFHIVHNGDAVGTGENISDAQVMSQIDALNLHYSAQDPEIGNVPAVFQSLVGNASVQFCLAKFDEDGNPTSGIIRHLYANVASWDSGDVIDNVLKPATQWDRDKYLNIWSVKMGGELAQSGVLAYATFPFFGPADEDGVVARFNTIGTTGSLLTGYNKGKTVSHEVGHWLGLRHIWGDDDGACTGSDNINDTPNAADANFGCPAFPHVTCNNGPNGDMFMNYMDYTEDACHSMFTVGQVDRMQTILTGFRSSIKTSSGVCYQNLDASVVKITLPGDTICSFTFTPAVTVRNEGLTDIVSGKFYYQIDGDVVQIKNWTGHIPMHGEQIISLDQQILGGGGIHTIDVTFTQVNGQASDNNSTNDYKSNSFFAYDAGVGSSNALAEGFESVYPIANWVIYNPNNDVIEWIKDPVTGAYGASSSSAAIDNLSYTANPNGKTDALITESFDLSGVAYPELYFDVAYARYNASRFDKLNVYYSLDCGSNWTKIFNQGGSQLATAPDQTTPFTPASNQWKTVSVPLSTGLSGQNKVSFKFENVSGWGNTLYLDNINLQNNQALSVPAISAKTEIKLFPNPASGWVGVRLPANSAFRTMQVINSVGEVVYQEEVNGNSLIFSSANFANGLYLIRFNGDAQVQTEKLLVVH